MSRERDGGREPRKEPVDRLTSDRARDGKAEEPLRFGPEREPQGDTSKGGRPDWKKASARKVRETTAPAEPERRGDGQPPPEQAAPNQTPEPEQEQEESTANPQEVEEPRGPDRPDPHGGPASRLRFDKESDTVKPEPDKAAAPKGSRPAGRGPSPTRLRPPKAPGLLAGGLLRPRRPGPVWDKVSRRTAPAASSERRATRTR